MALRQRSVRSVFALVLLGGSGLGVQVAQSAPISADQTYMVLFKNSSVPADTVSLVAAACGSVVYAYAAIGVVIARSSSASFRASLLSDNRVSEVGTTTGLATRLDNNVESTADAPGVAPVRPADIPSPDSDTFSSIQWDMTQIHAQDARKITMAGFQQCQQHARQQVPGRSGAQLANQSAETVQHRAYVLTFSQTEMWSRLSLVKGAWCQSLQRSCNRIPASWAIKSSSDGHT
jgi:hypothetical protein